MNNKISTGALTEGAIIAAITALLGVLSYYIPFLTLLIYIWPIPIIILGKRHGMAVSIVATIAAGLILSFLTPPIHAIQLVIMYGLVGIVLGYAYQKDMGIGKAILLGYVVALVSTVLLLQFYHLATGVNITDELGQMMKISLQEITKIYQQSGIDEGLIEETMKQVKNTLQTILQLLPVLLLMIPFIITIINMWIAEKILRRLGYPVKNLPPFWNWQLPNHVGFGLFAILFIVVLGNYLKIPKIDMVYLNLVYLIFLVFYVQGLAIVAYFFHEKKVSKGLWVLGFLLILIVPLFQIGVQFLGLFDTIFHFRSKMKLR